MCKIRCFISPRGCKRILSKQIHFSGQACTALKLCSCTLIWMKPNFNKYRRVDAMARVSTKLGNQPYYAFVRNRTNRFQSRLLKSKMSERQMSERHCTLCYTYQSILHDLWLYIQKKTANVRKTAFPRFSTISSCMTTLRWSYSLEIIFRKNGFN